LKKQLIKCGAVASMMSGSGTSVFGIFITAEEARAAVDSISSAGAFAALCYPYRK
jgi:4-diphosphocytidyl-2C-methyl-D-erythritol kinase